MLIVSVYQLVLVMTLLPFSPWAAASPAASLPVRSVPFIGSALMCFAPNLPLLLAARTLQALGAAAPECFQCAGALKFTRPRSWGAA